MLDPAKSTAATRYLPFALATIWVISSAVSVGQCCFLLLTFGRPINVRFQLLAFCSRRVQ
jgi:hypothetical protein